MPILFVNGKRRGKKVRGSASLVVAGRPKRRKGRMPAPLAAYWAKRRSHGRTTVSLRKPKAKRRRSRRPVELVNWKRGRRMAKRRASHRSIDMAKKRKRKKSGSVKVRRKRRKAASAAPKVRRKRRKAASAAPKGRRKRRKGRAAARRRMKAVWAARRKAGKRGRIGRTRKSMRLNPGRRRRYRRNPGAGGMFMDLVKRAAPVVAAYYLTRAVASKVGPMIPGISSAGSLLNPLMGIATIAGIHFASKKSAFVNRHAPALMLGAAVQVLDSAFQAFAPASVKQLVGMSDYVQMGMADYVAVGGVPPINDSMTLSDYIAVGGDGVEEELGLEEELGVEEELGNIGGLTGPVNGGLLKAVPTQAFVAPIPARSFTKQIPAAGASYDNPTGLFQGIFNGGFGH